MKITVEQLKPKHDKIVVLPAPAETTTAGGIIIPENAKEKPSVGTVVAVGEGLTDRPMTLKVGDTVMYGKFAGQEVPLVEGGPYLVMRDTDVLIEVEFKTLENE